MSWFHFSISIGAGRGDELRELLLQIKTQNQTIMANQSEDAAKLGALLTQLTKVNAEIQAKIQELIDAAANNAVTPELQAAIDALSPAVQALDDIVPDAPAPAALKK